MLKIAIIGYSGSGKSTLANFLGQHYNCEVLHLDKIHFTSNWQERTVDEMTDDISTFMLQRDWIIEGNYSENHAPSLAVARVEILRKVIRICITERWRQFMSRNI